MYGHILVSGEDALATTIINELKSAGASVVKLCDRELASAAIADAAAVVCAGDDDATNLEIALLARKANPRVRVVARLANDILRSAMAADNGPGAILNVADLVAPAIVEACLAHAVHPFEAAGVKFVVWGAETPHDATLRELYGDLAPVAVIGGENSPNRDEVMVCPGRDVSVCGGDWAAMIGTADEMAARSITFPQPSRIRARRPWLRRVRDAVRTIRDDVNPAFFPLSAAGLVLLIGSTVLLRFSYQRPPGMTWLDALYFSAETITTVGYGDVSFVQQPTWLRVFSVVLMFVGMATTAVLIAFIADLLLSRRFVHTAGRRRARYLRNHIIVVGLSALGIRVVRDLTAAGHDVAVIEHDESNRFLAAAAELDAPVVFGDATLRETLESAHVERARAVAVLTGDDMVNIEIGIVLREMLGFREGPERNRWLDVPIVLRVYDRALGLAVAQRFDFENVRSTVELAAPWFIGAAMGLQVLGTFSVGQLCFMIGAMHVDAGSELDGLRMSEMSTQTRVIAVARPNAPVELHPRRDAQLKAGDTAYLVGPYRELLSTLRKGQPSQAPAALITAAQRDRW
ncbi:potassium transporter TrkA [Mycobacterium heckeshornense]|nr:NAD-binding protein [Mycobacterium heckeshornense]KMV21538.1 potassium transporter TrkA [Mycobacterium heckeshornense]MCV7035844.1 NAD-binding protein [Mycobacterium heckeshornense]PIJ35876.1 potassium transporter TrkA [Mycobacterium heckeshornense]